MIELMILLYGKLSKMCIRDRYYIKALGRDGGVYVRVAGTTRLADEYMIKELLFEGSNRYYDQRCV